MLQGPPTPRPPVPSRLVGWATGEADTTKVLWQVITERIPSDFPVSVLPPPYPGQCLLRVP